MDGTYQTPSRELLRSTACSRGHELHHFVHPDNDIPLAPLTTGGKKIKTREAISHRQHIHDKRQQHLDDITLRIPHVTFRGQEVDIDNTFDADLPDDISALSFHLDCHAVTTEEDKKCVFEDALDMNLHVCDNESIDRSLVEVLRRGTAVANDEEKNNSGRDCVRNPVATTLHIEGLLQAEANNVEHQKLLKASKIREYIEPLLPVFTKARGVPRNDVRVSTLNSNVVRPVPCKARIGMSHGNSQTLLE